MKRILLSIVILISSVFLFAAENYYYEDYSVSIVLEENGVMHYKEDILVNYLSPMHGIYRDIQYVFDADPFYPIIADVSNVHVYDGVEASLSKDDTYYSIRFGSANRIVDGLVPYSFSYDFYLGADRYEDFDEFYQNILSSANGFPIKHLSFSVVLPKKCELDNNLWVTYGDYGSDNQLQYHVSADGLTISGEADNLRPYQAVTVRIQFPEGYYVGQEHSADYTIPAKAITALLSIGLLILGFFIYKKYGVDENLITPVRFMAPDGITPISADYLKNLDLNGSKDTVGMLFYWADKGYVEITDNGKKNFSIKALKPLENASSEETALYTMMFGSEFPSEKSVKDLGKKNLPSLFTSKIPNILRKKYSKENSLFEADSKRCRILILVLTAFLGLINSIAISIRYIGLLFLMDLVVNGVAFFIFSFIADRYSRKDAKGKSGKGLIILSAVLSVLFVYISLALDRVFSPGIVSSMHGIVFPVSFVLLIFLGYLTEKRSEFYSRTLEGLLGFEDFIKTVEQDRLKIMIDEDPAIFYHVLGYAVVFGLADEWAAKFKGLYVEIPGWYYSSDPIIDYMIFAHFADKWDNAYRNNMYAVPPGGGANSHRGGSTFSSFGSSGFSGGGFSGGGSRGW